MMVVFSANIEVSIPIETASAFTWRIRQDYLRSVQGATEEDAPDTPEDAFFEFLDCAIHGQCFNAAAEYGLNLDVYIPEESKRKAAKVDATGRPLIRGTLVRRGGGEAEEESNAGPKQPRAAKKKGDA
jgi:hypothetical protein